MISSQALACYPNSCTLVMCTFENQDAGRLAASGDRALAASGGALRSPLASQLTIPGASRGKSCGHPPPRLACRPLWAASRCAASRNTAALRQARCARWSVLPAAARGARRAPSVSGRGVFSVPRPHAFSATVARFHPDSRVRFAQSSQSSPGPSLRSGCGFRAAPGWPLHLGSTWLL